METIEPEGPAEELDLSFRTSIERRLNVLEGKPPGGADVGTSGDQDSLAGVLRTLHDRVTALETTTAENTSAVLRLADIVNKLSKDVAEKTPTPAQ